MDYAQQQRNPGKHTVGLGIVIALHVLLGWAIVSGLARKVVDVIKAPIETKIIEEVQPPPPPPPENLPPPPKFAPPPPSFVPPPEVVVNNPPPAPAITVTREAPPPAPVTIGPPPAPPAPPAPVAAPAPPAPPARTSPVIDFNTLRPEYPSAAARAQIEGETTISYTMDVRGCIRDVQVVKPAGLSREHRALDRAVVSAVDGKCAGKPGTVDGKPQTTTGTVVYVWKLE
ncbi:MAG: TonB family protein [Burkholderiaceae bacterium]|uniref:energy transducer TonB n=1 Tax=Rubrivivax albus TaxID=2499835 RepID=UPI0018EE4916|nr:TonB family protein [Rubrivivax albus]MCB1998401.1 TonB family protein [Rhodoferax sp.]MCP5272379.1 TonB family protein [Burkholderiaceae bacterium]